MSQYYSQCLKIIQKSLIFKYHLQLNSKSNKDKMEQNEGRMHINDSKMQQNEGTMHQNLGGNASKSRVKCIKLRVKMDYNEGKMH